MKALEAQSWTCAVVEQHIPYTFIKRDCYNMADILCCSPSKGIMLVQATGDTHGAGNLNARVAKIKAEPRHAIWLASGGRIQVWSWQKKAGQKERWPNVMEITKLDSQDAAVENAASEWRDIKTAPTTGRELIWISSPAMQPQLVYSNTWWIGGFSAECTPTLWKPRQTA